MNLMDFMMAMSTMRLTKSQFGKIMNDPDSSESEKEKALEDMAAAGGYENLDD